jgi:hypothetical protein
VRFSCVIVIVRSARPADTKYTRIHHLTLLN